MKPIIFAFPGNENLAHIIAQKLNYDVGDVVFHLFPDKEVLVKINSDVKNRDIIVIDSLNNPNEKILPLLFFAETARFLGAKKIKLVAPYLAYMRQDAQFSPQEGITSAYFAKLLSNYLEALIVVDPHLHRYKSLSEIYSIPAEVTSVTAQISAWIQKHIQQPVLIGPDQESGQCVASIAEQLQIPYLILEKIRYGDRHVESKAPEIEPYKTHTPVIIDDIISTGKTMIAAVNHLNQAQMKPTTCIAVHPVFVNHAYEELLASGVGQIVSCNTIQHPSNAIDISDALIDAIKHF